MTVSIISLRSFHELSGTAAADLRIPPLLSVSSAFIRKAEGIRGEEPILPAAGKAWGIIDPLPLLTTQIGLPTLVKNGEVL